MAAGLRKSIAAELEKVGGFLTGSQGSRLTWRICQSGQLFDIPGVIHDAAGLASAQL